MGRKTKNPFLNQQVQFLVFYWFTRKLPVTDLEMPQNFGKTKPFPLKKMKNNSLIFCALNAVFAVSDGCCLVSKHPRRPAVLTVDFSF
jgi:hypothetical protein